MATLQKRNITPNNSNLDGNSSHLNGLSHRVQQQNATGDVLSSTKQDSPPVSRGASPTKISLVHPFWKMLNEREEHILLAIQRLRNPFLDVWFQFWSEFGEEFGFILLLPGSSWFLGPLPTLLLTMVMAASIGFGNYLKNVFLRPRPRCPPVWCPNNRQKADHSFPSTHSITSITVPFYLFIFFYHLNEFHHLPLGYWICLAGVLVWSLSVISSRLYLGYHNPTDVIAGTFCGLSLLFATTSYFQDLIWMSLLTSGSLFPVFVFLFGALLLFIHPDPHDYTPAIAESGLVFGTAAGTLIGTWVSRHIIAPLHPYKHFQINSPIISTLTADGWSLFLRAVIGLTSVVIVRQLSKFLYPRLVLLVHSPRIRNGLTAKQEIDFIVKYFTYLSIAFTVTTVAPCLMLFAGLHDPSKDFAF